jgi:hypothetical protein
MLLVSKQFARIVVCSALTCLPLTSYADSTSPQARASASALSAPNVPGQVNRYTVPYFTSENRLEGSQSYTGITVLNNSAASCDASVKFQFGQASDNACVIKASIPPRTAITFCSRPGHDPVFPCNASCSGEGLTFTTGHAYIASTNNPSCSNIDVDAHLFFTTKNDTVVQGVTALTVTRFRQPNNGD